LAADRQLPRVRAIGTPNLSRRVARRRSQAAAMVAPPPVQAPSMAAMVGTGQRSMAWKTASMRSS